jgi:hypothetical protein
MFTSPRRNPEIVALGRVYSENKPCLDAAIFAAMSRLAPS